MSKEMKGFYKQNNSATLAVLSLPVVVIKTYFSEN